MVNSLSSGTGETRLEVAFPHVEVSTLVRADRRARDGLYQAHRWFARRPAPLVRSVLLAAAMPAHAGDEEFWTKYREPGPHLRGMHVNDPFLGGATTLIEAARLGARCSGSDIDPLVVLMAHHAVAPPMLDEFDAAAAEMLDYLHSEIGHLYPSEGSPLPLHTFSIARVKCRECENETALYRSLILSRGVNKAGAVARKPGMTIFCPDCYSIHEVDLHASYLECCGKPRQIHSGTFHAQKFKCPACGAASTHKELQTGLAPRQLVAVEETQTEVQRVIRQIAEVDREYESRAEEYLSANLDLPLPVAPIQVNRTDQRPISFGYKAYRDLFSSRQLALFGAAFSWITSHNAEEATTRALTLAVSNALATNNRLCGYAVDYGRLSALFSIRGYSLPAVAVELNALHPTAGRGTLPRVLARIRASITEDVRRYVYMKSQEAPVAVSQRLPILGETSIVLASATEEFVEPPTSQIDMVVTDPPYFDFIPYDELSAFYRAWITRSDLAGDALHPPSEGNRANVFGKRLGKAFSNAMINLRPTGLVIFTYHSSNPEAWHAIAVALDEADLRVTALWPVLADPHMGHHGTSGACEYDLVIVARSKAATYMMDAPFSTETDGGMAWLAHLGLKLNDADKASARYAYSVCAARWGAVVALRDDSPALTW